MCFQVISLYPWVLKYGMFPVGHPEITLNPDIPSHENFEGGLNGGVWKIKILPPKDLFHPVLPYRSKGPDGNTKLTFPLCRTCADGRQNSPCHHSDEERAFTGSWTHLDVGAALKRGYRILEAHEHWWYPMEYMGKDMGKYKSEGLFTR